MKQCPRCKTVFAKSRNNKLECRACGYVTRDIEVVSENQQFQQRHNFTKKIREMKKTPQEEHKTNITQKQEMYIRCFQQSLKRAFNSFSSSYIPLRSNAALRSKLLDYIGNIWFQYIRRIRCEAIDKQVYGVLKRIHKKLEKRNHLKVKLPQEKEEQEQEEEKVLGQKIDVQANIGVFEEEKDLEYNQIGFEKGEQVLMRSKKKRGRQKMKVEVTQQNLGVRGLVKKQLFKINKNSANNDERIEMFANFLLGIRQESFEVQDLVYIAQRYVFILLNKQQKRNKDKKNRPIGLRQLLAVMHERKHSFRDRNNIILVILLEDLLRRWINAGDASFSLTNLIQEYQGSQNLSVHQISIINSLIDELRQHNNQVLVTSNPKKSRPKLCFSLVYTLIYLGVLHCNLALEIDEIVVGCGQLYFEIESSQKQKEIFKIEEKISCRKIRKQAYLMHQFLGIREQTEKLCLKVWIQKYLKEYQLLEHFQKVCLISETLYHPLPETNKDRIESYLSQDIISKAVILIFLKLYVGFDNQPYLLTIPKQVLEHTEEQKQFFESFIAKRGNQINLIDLLKRIQSINSLNVRKLSKYYPLSSYKSIDNLDLSELKKIQQKWIKPKLISLPAPSFKNATKITVFQLKKDRQPTQSKKLRSPIMKQIQLIKNYEDEKQQFEKIIQHLDFPSDNYEFLYKYNYHARYMGREIFVYLTEQLTGENKKSELYGWLQKLQTILIRFEN